MRQLTTVIIVITLVLSGLCLPLGSVTGSDAHTSNTADPVAPRKRALFVGISKYDRGSQEKNKDWWDLNTEADMDLLKKVLIEKFQFEPNDIKVLTTREQTTHQAIITAFRDFLIKPAGAGDIVFFHFSGHGQQVPDDNGDETDGYDETLVPSDYISQKDGSKNIRDDEIGKLLDELKDKKPGNVTISLDSCFSGTATRGELPPRGGPWQGEPVSANKIRGEETSPSGLLSRGGTTSEGYVFISAASPRQTAKEVYNDDNNPMGLYTYALVKTLYDAGPKTTYRDLFERLNDTVTRKRGDQNPQLEGELDKELMKGTALPPQRYLAVKPDGKGGASLQAGKLQGMTLGSRFAIYPAGTKDPKEGNKLADAEINDLDITTATLKLSSKVDEGKLRAARAFETEHRYDDTVLKVVTQSLESVEGGKEALAQIKSFDLAETEARATRNYDVLIYPPTKKEVEDKIVDAGFRGVILERNNGTILAKLPEGPNMGEQIRRALESEARWVTIKNLGDTDPSIKIELRLIPVEVELNERGRVRKVVGEKKEELFRGTGNQLEFTLGDHIMLELRNTGEEEVYVTVLNLRSDGKVGPGWPQQIPNVPAQDNLLKKGQVLRIREPYVFRITEPLGDESFRAIATREPTDFTPLIDPDLLRRGDPQNERGQNAARSPLGRILKAAQQGKRSDLSMDLPPAWATYTVTFKVKPKG